MTSTDPAGTTALVTGATSGIGRAAALSLARLGAHVLVSGRDAIRGGAAVAEIRSAGGKADFIAADLADASSVRALARRATELGGGKVDILVSNAGVCLGDQLPSQRRGQLRPRRGPRRRRRPPRSLTTATSRGLQLGRHRLRRGERRPGAARRPGRGRGGQAPGSGTCPASRSTAPTPPSRRETSWTGTTSTTRPTSTRRPRSRCGSRSPGSARPSRCARWWSASDGRVPSAYGGNRAHALHRQLRRRPGAALLRQRARRRSAAGREPSEVALANSWLIINVGGLPTDDKPMMTLQTPQGPDHVSSILNIRVADVHAVYQQWHDRGASS